MRTLFAVMMLALLPGCGKFDVTTQPVPEMLEAHNVCIVENNQTKEGFKQAIASWLTEEGIKYRYVNANDPADDCDWSLNYYGRWSWDLALFLSDAKIDAFKAGEMKGFSKLRVGQWDAYKFEDGTARIHKMMDLLTGKATTYVLPEAKKK